jgi:nitroimidazol reductase NimA-like FMN-containing flavoprotein (pyridoxamine 5'-phosphate oxidase superfamily)
VDPEASSDAPSDRTRLHREPERGSYDPQVIREIIDTAPICHLGLTDSDGRPLVIPTIHARVGDVLYIHGSVASRTIRRLAEGIDVCCTITLVDGIVVARSAFWSSMNYRSVMVFGRSRLVTDPEEVDLALGAIVERMIPGRTSEIREPTGPELRATRVIALPLDEASAKVRTGDPNDDPADLGGDAWAGVVPFTQLVGVPIPAENLAAGIPVPPSVQKILERGTS